MLPPLTVYNRSSRSSENENILQGCRMLASLVMYHSHSENVLPLPQSHEPVQLEWPGGHGLRHIRPLQSAQYTGQCYWDYQQRNTVL